MAKSDDDDIQDLDYHITFPSPVSRGSVSDEDYVDVGEGYIEGATNEDKEPVVILLGWTGCREKDLAKYSSIYKHRCITIRYTAPVEEVFMAKQERLRTIACKVLELVSDLSLEDNPILFHVFSNGGGCIYRHIAELVHSSSKYSHLQIRGVIFDSCPCKRRVQSALQALKMSIEASVFVKYLLSFLLLIYLVGQALINTMIRFCGGQRQLGDQFWNGMLNDPSRWPQLYLYSKADELIPYIDVETVIAHRKDLGVQVYTQCWEDSAHVAHLRSHREPYIKACYDFLDMCIGPST